MTGSNKKSIEIFANGSSYFAGTMGIGAASASPNITLNADGSASFAKRVFSPTISFGSATGHGFSLSEGFSVAGRKYGTISIQAESGIDVAQKAVNVYLGTSSIWSVDYRGTAAFSNAILNLEADDDTKYTATTDSEGNETRVYNGAVLDVKERLTKADAALVALKSAAAAATDFASLQSAIATALADI